MSPLEASTILATLVGLLCNWKQERGAVAQDRFQDFITWLEQHHFNELRAKILESNELQRDLGLLLREDFKSLSAKLDVVCSGVSSIANRIEHLSSVAQLLKAPKEDLSDQAVQILAKFEGMKASHLLIEGTDPDCFRHIAFAPTFKSYQVTEPRFLQDDVVRLCEFNFLREVDFNGKGYMGYTLTRPGAAFAKQLPLQNTCLKEAEEPEMVSEGGSY